MKMMAGLVINRPVDQVFAYVVNMEQLPNWARGVVTARRTTPGPEGVGTTYQITGRVMGREVGSTYQLTAYDPPTTFAATGAIGPFPLREVYTLTPLPGGTRISVVSEMEVHGALQMLVPLLRPLLARVIQGDLVRLQRRLEAVT